MEPTRRHADVVPTPIAGEPGGADAGARFSVTLPIDTWGCALSGRTRVTSPPLVTFAQSPVTRAVAAHAVFVTQACGTPLARMLRVTYTECGERVNFPVAVAHGWFGIDNGWHVNFIALKGLKDLGDV